MQKSDSDRDLKAVAITKLMAPLPSYRKAMLFIVALSFIAGIAISILHNHEKFPSEIAYNLLYGGSEGVLILGIPAIIAAAFVATVTRKEKFKDRLRHFSFIALLSVIISAVIYEAGLLLSQTSEQLMTFILLANSVVFLIWFVAVFVTLNYGWKTIFISSIQPILNIAFFIIYNTFLVANLQDPFTVGIKFIVSTAVMLLALASIFYIINAPARSNFGISTLEVMALFSAQWTYGSKGLEEVLADMGEKVETFYSTIIIRSVKTKKLKAIWLVPYVHFGPVGNLGGSEFPSLLSKPLSEKYNVPVAVYHATVNHDFNPVYSSIHSKFETAFENEINSLRKNVFEKKMNTSLLLSNQGSARIFGLNFGEKNGFFAFSNAPKSTEDIEFPAGLILMNKLMAKGLDNAVLADMHNSKTNGDYFLAGTPEFFEVYDLLDSYKKMPQKPFQFGAYADRLEDLGVKEGIGKMGMIVSIFQVQNKLSCIILIDSNNCLPEFRRETLLRIAQKHKFDFVDIFTTDTHSVNTISGIHNPLGKYCDRPKLAKRIDDAIDNALDDMEIAESAMSTKRMEIEVLGARRSPEVISTINSIVSIAKIFAPSILIISLFIAFVLSLAIK